MIPVDVKQLKRLRDAWDDINVSGANLVSRFKLQQRDMAQLTQDWGKRRTMGANRRTVVPEPKIENKGSTNSRNIELEDQIKGHSKVKDLGPWEALAQGLMNKTDGSSDLKPQLEDDGSISDLEDDDKPIGSTEIGIGLAASDAQRYTDDGSTDAHDAYEWESVQPELKEMFDLQPTLYKRYKLSDILEAYLEEDL